MSGSTVVRGSGVFLDGRTCLALWQPLRQAIAEAQQRDGGAVRPEVAEAVEAMRQAASDHLTHQQVMSAMGRNRRTSVDIAPLLLRADRDDLTAAELGELLHCTPRHARRLATDAGVQPRASRPYRWAKADVAVLLEQRPPA